MSLEGARRREHKRASLELPIVLITTSYGTTTIASGRSRDISEGGIGIITGAVLRERQPVSIEVKVPLENLMLKMHGEVRHYGSRQCGVQFTAMTDPQLEQLRKLMN